MQSEEPWGLSTKAEEAGLYDGESQGGRAWGASIVLQLEKRFKQTSEDYGHMETPTLSLEVEYAGTCLCLTGCKGHPELGNRTMQRWLFQWYQDPTYQDSSTESKDLGSLAALRRG